MRTCGGTRSKYASSSARSFVVPVGLFGAAMNTSFVRSRDRGEHRVEVDALVLERDADGNAAELQRVDDVARERRPAGHDLVPRVERGQADVADDRVGTGADRHLLEAHAVLLGEDAPKAPRAAVRVAIQLERRPRDRFLRGRERPVRPLVRRELDDAVEPELALNLLDRLAGLVRNEPVERGTDERPVAAGAALAHVAGAGSGAVTYSPTISLSPSKLDTPSATSPARAPQRDGERPARIPAETSPRPTYAATSKPLRRRLRFLSIARCIALSVR